MTSPLCQADFVSFFQDLHKTPALRGQTAVSQIQIEGSCPVFETMPLDQHGSGVSQGREINVKLYLRHGVVM